MISGVSIIIVNYNTFDITCQCIKSLCKNVQIPFEVILVDNGSKECDPREFLKYFSEIKLLPQITNVGFSRANNEGIKAAIYNTILFLNSDTIVFDSAIEKTLNFLHANEEVGVVGCRLLNRDRSVQPSSMVPIKYPLLNLLINGNPFLNFLNKRLGLSLRFSHEKITMLMQEKTHVCEAVSGAFMMVKEEVIQTCGSFDPDFFMYSEDTEWCRNRIRNKFKVMYFAEAEIIHIGGGSATSINKAGQAMLSSFLYNYKVGYTSYFLSILIYFFNTMTTTLALPLISYHNRINEWQYIKAFLKILPKLAYDIPRYGRKYGSRENPLVYNNN